MRPYGFHFQGAEEPKLKWEHITTLIASLREFVRSTDRKIIATTLSKLKLELDFDSHGINQVQVVLFGFQDAVSAYRQGALGSPPQALLSIVTKIGYNCNSVPFHLFSQFHSLWMTDVRHLLGSPKDKRPNRLTNMENSKTYKHSRGWFLLSILWCLAVYFGDLGSMVHLMPYKKCHLVAIEENALMCLGMLSVQ